MATVRLRNPIALASQLGPGLITGAADDDPSGIATYSQAGAQFGFGLGWVLVLTWPLMCAIQEISARIGRVTGHGIAGVIKRHLPAPVLYVLVALLVVANTINLGADLGAMGAATQLLIGGPPLLYVAAFGVVSLLLEVFLRYSRYVSVLKWLSLSLFAYVGVAFVVKMPWASVAYHLVEEVKERNQARPLERAPEQAKDEFRRIRIDTYLGMFFSNAVAIFILITTAATLNAHGVTNIQTSSDAALALKPIAGPFVFLVFALGIIGTGMLAVPVLAGSSAYAVGETFGLHVGLSRKLNRAPTFYGVVAAAFLVGVGLNVVHIDPIKALFWSAVINGVVAVPVMTIMMILASRRSVMGDFVLPPALKVLGWLATAVMLAAAIAMFATWGQ